ncbi:MAG: hypothetical protein FGM14_15770 [Flavobacteriales bacterium]|nr:hypothetical protein [Flavobacteriales bacterium]
MSLKNLFNLTKNNIYGASRLGMRRKGVRLYENGTSPYTIPDVQQNTHGDVAYEITNYLGNVNVVISDRKIWNATPISAFKACVVSRTDYFPFGMLNDTWFSGTESLSGINPDWSFSGISGESDNETKGVGILTRLSLGN